MPNGSSSIIVKVFAYGVPALLIVLGFLAFTGGKFAEAIFGTSEGMVGLGIGLIIIGIILYLTKLILRAL